MLTEKEARVQLARAYRIFAHLGWSELIFNHITLAMADRPNQFLLNPFGLTYSEVTPENLLVVDCDGNLVEPSEFPANPAGFTIHGAIHRARGVNAACVMHTHTTAGMAVACLDQGLSWSNFYAAQLFGAVGYHDYEGITDAWDEMPRLLASLGAKDALILRNHGLLACGPSIEDSFYTLWKLNRACEIQLATMSMGVPRVIPNHVLHRNACQIQTFDPSGIGAARVYRSLAREVGRKHSAERWLQVP